MTFSELEKRIKQTDKSRKGIKNRIDYFENNPSEDFYRAVYKKALAAATQVVKHYEEVGEISPKDKVKVEFK